MLPETNNIGRIPVFWLERCDEGITQLFPCRQISIALSLVDAIRGLLRSYQNRIVGRKTSLIRIFVSDCGVHRRSVLHSFHHLPNTLWKYTACR